MLRSYNLLSNQQTQILKCNSDRDEKIDKLLMWLSRKGPSTLPKLVTCFESFPEMSSHKHLGAKLKIEMMKLKSNDHIDKAPPRKLSSVNVGLIFLVLVILVIIIFFCRHEIFYQLRLYKSRTLPYAYEHFVDRKTEVTRILEALSYGSSTKLFTIIGPPGFGKSTLAVYVGHQLLRKGTVVHYIDMNEVNTVPTMITGKILDCANIISEHVNKDRAMKWARDLGDLTVLVLDNCDKIQNSTLEEFQKYIDELLKNSNNLKILITTRQKDVVINYNEENTTNLEELPLHDACKVLEQTGLSSDVQESIANLTGRSPLALQIIGSLFNEVNSPSPNEIISRLKSDQIIDTLSPPYFPPERRVSASINVSYGYLKKEEREFGHFLAYFPGSFSEAAACHAFSYEKHDECKTLLSALVRRSLLQYNSRGYRYQYHVLIKSFFVTTQIPEIQSKKFWKSFKEHYIRILQIISFSKDSVHLLTTEKHNILKLLEIITEVKFDTNDVFDIANALNELQTNKQLLRQFANNEILIPATEVVKKLELHQHDVAQTIPTSEHFLIYGNLVMHCVIHMNDSSNVISFMESKLPHIETLILKPFASNSLANQLYASFMSILSDLYYERGNHSLVRLCHQKVQNRTNMLIRCERSSCQYYDIAINYQSIGDHVNSIKFFEYALRHQYMEPLQRVQAFIHLHQAYKVVGSVYKTNDLIENATSLIQEMAKSPNILFKNIEKVKAIIQWYRDIGKVSEADELLHITLGAVMKVGGRLDDEDMINASIGWCEHLYNNGNFSEVLDISEIVVRSLSVSLSQYNHIRLLMGLSLYYSGNTTQGLNTLYDVVGSFPLVNLNESLIVRSCFVLSINGRPCSRCLVLVLVLAVIFTMVFAGFIIPKMIINELSLLYNFTAAQNLNEASSKFVSTEVTVRQSDLMQRYQSYVQFWIENMLSSAFNVIFTYTITACEYFICFFIIGKWIFNLMLIIALVRCCFKVCCRCGRYFTVVYLIIIVAIVIYAIPKHAN